MKKVGYVVVVMLLLVLTGCGKTTKMTCKLSQTGVDLDYNLEFNGNMLSKMSLKYVMDLSNYTDTQIEAVGKQDFCNVLKDSMSQYKEGFENCNQKIEDKNMIVYTDINPDKVTNSVLDKMGSVEDTKKALEDIGYKCTTN